MKKKNYLTLDDEFIKYCELNNIDDIEKYAKEIFNKGFTVLKYGDKPKIEKITVETSFKSKVNPIPEKTIKKWEKLGEIDGIKPVPPPTKILYGE